MGEGSQPLLSIAAVLTCGALLSFLPCCAAKELRREATCYSDVMHLGCGKHSFVAIHAASFSSEHSENQTCQAPSLEDEYIDDRTATGANHTVCREDIRLFINRKCSGLKSCNFSYNQEPERSCSNSEGIFVVEYDCVRESNVNRYCNSPLSGPEGYVSSPGFPQYYPALRECSWLLTASDGQVALIRVLSLHLRPPQEISPTPQEPYFSLSQPEPLRRCDDDALVLMQGVTKRLSVCGESVAALREERLEGGEALEIRFKSVGFLPASGFLIHYKVQGCPSLAPSDGSYLVERNTSWARYACAGTRRFNDTGRAIRSLQCVRDHHWNDTLPPCTEPFEEQQSTTFSSNVTTGNDLETNGTVFISSVWDIIKFPSNAGFIEDILIPCVLIGILLVGNIIIVTIIFILRRRQKPSEEEEDGVLEEVNPSQTLVTEEKV